MSHVQYQCSGRPHSEAAYLIAIQGSEPQTLYLARLGILGAVQRRVILAHSLYPAPGIGFLADERASSLRAGRHKMGSAQMHVNRRVYPHKQRFDQG